MALDQTPAADRRGRFRPRARPLVLCLLLGVLVGGGAFVAVYAHAASYLSNDPSACVNCHVMREQFDAWSKAPHHAVARCNDCHVPHDTLRKYWAKAVHGYRHSRAFTLQDYGVSLRMTERSAADVRENCIRCHRSFVSAVGGDPDNRHEDPDCIRCHRGVGHGASI